MQNANEFMISSALAYKISYIYENNGLLTSISHVFPHSSAMLSFSLFFFFRHSMPYFGNISLAYVALCRE